MIPYPEARARVLARVPVPVAELVPLVDAGGRVLAEDLVVPHDVPHFDNSQVDGYAVRAEDALTPRRLVGVSAAGGATPPRLGPGEAIRIFTGAPIPPCADAVVMQEDVLAVGEEIRFAESPVVGQNVRARGEELRGGTILPVAGRILTPPLVGLAASFGRTELSANRRPRVAIVATGSELVPVGTELGPGQVYASNAWALRSAIEALGFPTPSITLVRDDPDETRAALDHALDGADVLITIGGVSVGDHDLVRGSLASIGVEEVFWRVAMKPGKPFAFGMRDAQMVFGLPGNPVSSLVTYLVLVRPALLKWVGISEESVEIEVRAGVAIRRRDTRYEFLRATLSDGVAHPVTHQGSHMQSGLAGADALLHLPDGVARIEAGSTLRATPIRWGLSSWA